MSDSKTKSLGTFIVTDQLPSGHVRKRIVSLPSDMIRDEVPEASASPPTAVAAAVELLSAQQTAALLNLAPITLAKWRLQGTGPAFLKLGRRVAYRRVTIDEWLAAKVRRSTSERGDGT